MQRPPSDVESSITLKYPTIPVHGTPASWGSHSQLVTMTSNHDESGDDTTSSLGDSSYDFIDDRSNVTTDDEDQDAMTASTTSSDGHAFEQVDVHIRRRRPSDYADQPSNGQAPSGSNDQEASSGSEPLSSSQGSAPRITTDSGYYDEHEPIEFDEPSVTNLNSSRFTEVCHTLKIVEKRDCLNVSNNDVLDRLQGQLALTVRQTMTSQSLAPQDGQYKVLYVGDPSAREPIVQKIGTALAAGLTHTAPDSNKARASKFSIVPISAFGEGCSPEVVLIDSSGLELTVEDCSYASFARKIRGNDSLCMRLSNGTIVESSWTGAKFDVSNDWRLPDIALFCLPDNDSSALQMTRQFARSFMSRHKILSIVISQSSLWDKSPTEHITLDYLTPHICLESRKSSFASTQIIRRFPIDLTTFLNIDAGQMNRNLACLAAAPGSSKSRQNHKQFSEERPRRTAANGPWSLQEVFQSVVYDVQKDGLKGLNQYEYIAGLAVVLMSILGVLVVGLGLTELLGASKVSNSRVFPTQIVVPATRSTSAPRTTSWSSSTPLISSKGSCSLSNTPTLVLSSASSIFSSASAARSSSSTTDLAAFLLDAYTLAPHKSEQFKVHVLGDSHIVLRSPHWFSKMKKTPNLLFKVLRGDTELEHQTTILFDGVYALQIPREDTYGVLTVEVWTESKPVINENFEVDFGSSWLKVRGWKKATRVLTETVRDDLHSMQTSLSTIYDRTRTGLSTFVQQRRKKVALQNAAEKAILKRAAAKTKELIVAQTRDIQRDLALRLYGTRVAASNKIRNRAGKITKDLALYTRNTTSLISRQARVAARSVSNLNVKGVAQSIENLRRCHLREMQKKTLKTWWKIRGPPMQKRMKANTKARGPRPVI